MSNPIRQTITFNASPHEVYEMLMDSKKHAKFTGSAARVSRKVRGEISAYDGYISGENVELVQDRKIVQLWRGSDWDGGVFSKATFSLKKVKGGTRLTFAQTGVPEKHYSSIKQGWIDFYWEPMKAIIEKRSG